MAEFLRENWLWIVTPMVLILMAVVVLVVLEMNTGGEHSVFDYNLF